MMSLLYCKTEETSVRYEHGSAVPRYVERLDDVEWVTDRRAPRSAWLVPLSLAAIVAGVMLLVLGFAMVLDDRPPADRFPSGRISTPPASPHM